MIIKPDYIMGDLHLGNDCNMFKRIYSKTFETIDDYHEGIIQKWNQKIPNNSSVVLVLGDIGCSHAINEVIPKLRGQKYLILGNHDNYAKAFYNKYFIEVFNHPIFVAPRIVFSHIPIPTEPGVINFHGHTHHVSLKSERHFNLCPEHYNYTPILYKKLEQKLSLIDKPNYKFLEEWYKDIQLTTIKADERDDIILKKDGTIDVEKSKPLVFLKRYKGKVKKGLVEFLSDEEILDLYEKHKTKLDKIKKM